MTFRDILRRSWRNLGRAKVRVGLTAAALAIGAATMTMALAITQGAQDSIQKSFGGFANNYILVEGFAAKNDSATGVQTTEEANQAQKDARAKDLGQTDVQTLKLASGVKEVVPLSYYRFDEVVLAGKSYQSPSTLPLTPLDKLQPLIAGKREDLKGDTVIIPERYVTQAGVKTPAEFIGKKLTFVKKGLPSFFGRPAEPDTSIELTVVGVTQTRGGASSVSTDYAYLSPEAVSSFANKNKGTAADISYTKILLLTDEAQTDTLAKQLTDKGYEVKTQSENAKEALEAVNAIRTVLLVFAGIAIFTAIFGVINTQLMSVLERTREIGIMKALGMSRGAVLLMFSIEAGWIGFIGSIAGTLIAIPFTLILNSIGKDNFNAPITLPNFLIVVVVLVAIAMLSGLLPARRAAKLDPVEALRGE